MCVMSSHDNMQIHVQASYHEVTAGSERHHSLHVTAALEHAESE